MDDDFIKFTNSFKKKNYPKRYKFFNSYKVYDVFARMKDKLKNKGVDINLNVFRSLVPELNLVLADELFENGEVHIPKNLGIIRICKYKTKNKLNNIINWAATYKLWHEDEEAFKEKILIRSERNFYHKILWFRYNAKFKNKNRMQFDVSKNIRIRLDDMIKNNDFDTFLFTKIDKNIPKDE